MSIVAKSSGRPREGKRVTKTTYKVVTLLFCKVSALLLSARVKIFTAFGFQLGIGLDFRYRWLQVGNSDMHNEWVRKARLFDSKIFFFLLRWHWHHMRPSLPFKIIPLPATEAIESSALIFFKTKRTLEGERTYSMYP